MDLLWPGYSESDSLLAAYVVMPDPLGALEAGQPMYTNGFLPAVYQPTTFHEPGIWPGVQPWTFLEGGSSCSAPADSPADP